MQQRVHAQHIARPRFRRAGELVRWMGAIQAQDPAACRWAVGLRLGGEPRERDIEAALDAGEVLRLHCLRGTWQLVAPADARWILELVAPRVIAQASKRYAELGLDAATLRKSQGVLARALRGGTELTRDEVADCLASAGISTTGQRLSFLLHRAELESVVCSGARRGKHATYTLFDRRVPAARPFDRSRALAELAKRYFQSRAPATAADFAWWSGLGPDDVREAMHAIHGGPSAKTTRLRASAGAVLLPALDEYLIGYADRTALIAPAFARRLHDGGGILKPTVLINARVRGVWRRTLSRREVLIDVEPFESLAPLERRAVERAAVRYGEFLGLTPVVTLHPSRAHAVDRD